MVVDGEYSQTPINLVGNYVMAPNADGHVYGVRVLGPKPVSLFVKDNIGPFRSLDHLPDELFVDPGNRSRECMVPNRHQAPPVTTLAAAEALRCVLDGAGCVLPARDAIDERMLSDARERRTRLIHDPSEVGGWSVFPDYLPQVDSDRDGMPDDWEVRYRFDAMTASNAKADTDGDGYTDLEEYLNRTDSLRIEQPY